MAPATLARPAPDAIQSQASDASSLSPDITSWSPREQLELFESIFRQSSAGIAIIDTRGQYLVQNSAHRELIGFSDEELRGRTPAIHLGEEQFSRIARALADTGHYRGQVRSETRRGPLDIELIAFAIRDPTGRVVAYVGIKRDISRLRRNEELLAQRVNHLGILYELSDRTAKAGSLAEVQEVALRLTQRALGLDRSAILLFDDQGVMRFQAWSGLSDAYRMAVEGHSPWPRDDPDPQPVLVEDALVEPTLAAFRGTIEAEGVRSLAFVPMVAEGRLVGKFMLYCDRPRLYAEEEVRLAKTIVSTVAGAIQRKQAELDLRRSQRELQDLVENAAEGLHWVDLDGRILWANRAELEMLGYAEEEYVGRNVAEFYAEPDKVADLLAGLKRGEEWRSVEATLRAKDGSLRHVLIDSNGYWEDERFVHMRCFTRDITDRKRAEERLRFLAEASQGLSATLDYDRILSTIPKVVVPRLADYCALYLVDRMDQVRLWTMGHARAERSSPALPHPEPTLDPGIIDAVRKAKSELRASMDGPRLAARQHDESPPGARSRIVVPLRSKDRTVGALLLAAIETESPRRFSHQDLELAEELARRAAIAIDNAELFSAQRAAREEAEGTAAQLHVAEERLRAVLSNTQAVVFVKDLEGHYLVMNPHYLDLLGVTEAEAYGKTDHNFHPSIIADPLRENDRRVVEDGQSLQFEETLLLRDGLHTFLSMKFPLHDSRGVLYGIGGVCTDITERKTTETLLRESEERFRAVTESAQEAIISTDSDGNIVQFNPAAERIFGYREQDILGRPLLSLFPDSVGRGQTRGLAPFFGSGSHGQKDRFFELPGLRRTGEEFPLEMSLASWVSGGRKYFTGILRDASDRKRAQEDLRALNASLEERVRKRTQQLEQAIKERESFSYSVSHDLRTPLRTIRGFTTILKDDYKGTLDPRATEYLDFIHSATGRMANIIDDLLKLSRIQRGDLHRAPIDLADLARSIVRRLQERDSARAVDVKIADGLATTADPQLVEVIMDNLLENAWKFTRDIASPRVEIGAVQQNGTTEFYVRDNGAGFDMAYGDRLFKPFQRLHSTREFEGTGIGLATVARIVERHGGRVRAEGKVGQGATFYFSLHEG